MDTTIRLSNFEKFYKALMSNAPEGYVPWFFPLKENNKDPDGYAIAARAKHDTPINERSSWKAIHAKLSYEEAIAVITNGKNVGIAARKNDWLHISDSDSEIEGFDFKGIMCRSRTRFGRHYFNWMNPEQKKNIPTDKNGEVRSVDQYVVAAGSFVKVTDNDLKKKFEEGSITLERIKELLSCPDIGLYSYEEGIPETITPDELPEVFLKQQHKDDEGMKKKVESEMKKSFFTRNDDKRKTTRLFELNIGDVCSITKGRTGHPLHDSDTGTNWMISGNLGHCWRHGVSLNAYQYLAVELGLASCGDAGTKTKLEGSTCNISGDKSILFKIWCEAKRRGLLKEDDPVPYSCLTWIKGKPEGKLDTKDYNEAIDLVEKEVCSGREKKNTFVQLGDLFDWKVATEDFVDKYPHYYDRAGLWWQWNEEKKKWSMIDETDILIAIDEEVKKNTTLMSSVKSQIIEGLRRAARKREPLALPDSCVQFKDKIFNIETGEEFEATPQYFNKNPIPWELSNSTETPTIDRIFGEWVGEDKKQMLYEIIAFSCVPCYFIHRAFAFIGSGSNGKSKYLGVVRTLIGKDNYCDTDLEDIATNRFESSKLYGKLVAFLGETNFKAIDKTSRFKKFTGQDPVSFEFKNKNGFTDMNTAKILVSTNSLPITMDKTKGFYRRWIVISFNKEFPETIDILKTIPEEEYCNLATKSLGLLRSLWSERKFTGEGSIEDRRKAYEEKSNPFRHFLNEEFEKDEMKFVFKYELRDEFETFCKTNGYRTWSQKEVGTYMSDEGYDTKQMLNPSSGNYNWAYMGLSRKKQDYANDSNRINRIITVIPLDSISMRETDMKYPNNPVNPVMESSPLTVTTTEESSHNEDEWLRCKAFIEKHPLGNAFQIDEVFGNVRIMLWLRDGRMMENPAGTYRLI